MKATSYGFHAAIIALSVGCGAADYVEDSERSAVADIEATSDAPAAGESLATNLGVTGEERRLAKIEFEDGNVVTFESLGTGVLVFEVGPLTNPKHFRPNQNFSPTETFRQLAPGREVPAALAATESRFARGAAEIVADPEAAQIVADPEAADATGELETLGAEPAAEESERSGQFEQSGGFYPYSQFQQDLCAFTITSEFDFKHGNSNVGHNHIADRSHRTWVAVGTDIGDVTIQFCARGVCNPQYYVPQGSSGSLYYDAGIITTSSCLSCVFGYCIGCKTTHYVQYPDVRLKTTNVLSGERFHDCGWFVPEGL